MADVEQDQAAEVDEAEASGASAAGPAPGRTDDDPAAVAAQQAERSRRRMRQTVRDMLLSMLVVGAAVLVLVAPWDRQPEDAVRTVDPTSTIAAAREALDWPVLAPTGDVARWRVTSARVDSASDGKPVVWLGYLTPATRYVGVVQSATQELAFVRDTTLDGRPTGTVEIGGRTWERRENADATRRSLVAVVDGTTYVVTGAAPWADVEQVARSLVGG